MRRRTRKANDGMENITSRTVLFALVSENMGLLPIIQKGNSQWLRHNFLECFYQKQKKNGGTFYICDRQIANAEFWSLF